MTSRYFVEPEGLSGPELWQHTDLRPHAPLLVLRKADLPARFAWLIWRVVTGVLAPDDATVERVTDALIGNRPQLVALRLVPEGTRDIYRSDARAVLAALADPDGGAA